MDVLRVRNVTKSFRSLPVLQDVSFEVKEDEIVAVIGPSGCGKSTLLNAISGLVSPDRGIVEADRECIAYVFQDNRLLPWETVYDNVRLVRNVENREEILGLIEAVGLKGFEGFYPSQLSGGMLKRCGIARAFYYPSRLLLMDEPFQGLDYCLRQEMLSTLLRVWETRRQGVLFITHEIDEALTVASRILVFSRRPARVIEEISLSGREGRHVDTEELSEMRARIISLITV